MTERISANTAPPLPSAPSRPATVATGGDFKPVQIPPELREAAAERLIPDSRAGQGNGGRRLLAAAHTHGINLTHMWGTLEPCDARPGRIRHVCLAVPGSGRTAMLVLSGPRPGDETWLGSAEEQVAERSACISCACRDLGAMAARGDPSIAIMQALPDPKDVWAVSAFVRAGFTRIADLAYMMRPHPGPPLEAGAGEPAWPCGITVRTVRGCAPGEPDRDLLIEALERTYEDTLDCPGLCGLRSTSDVLDSHRASGRWDGRHWRLVFQDGRPHGCLLLSQCPESHVIELVYLGLSPALRGRGLGRKLLLLGLSRVRALDADHVTCAVDTRNLPALGLYEAVSFATSARRVALVRPVAP